MGILKNVLFPRLILPLPPTWGKTLMGALMFAILFEPAHGKTYNKNCATSKDSDQPVRPPSMVRVCFSLNSLEAVEGTCDQRSL